MSIFLECYYCNRIFEREPDVNWDVWWWEHILGNPNNPPDIHICGPDCHARMLEDFYVIAPGTRERFPKIFEHHTPE